MEITQYIFLFFIEIVVLAVLLGFIMNHSEQGETVANSWNGNLDAIQSFVGNDYTNTNTNYNNNYMIYNHTEVYGFELQSMAQSLNGRREVMVKLPPEIKRDAKYLLIVTYDTDEAKYNINTEEVVP